MNVKMIAAVVVLLCVAVGAGYWLGRSGPELQSTPVELQIPGSAVVLGTREGVPNALVDISAANSALNMLDATARDTSVRQAISGLAEIWYQDGKVPTDARVLVEIVTITKRDEYNNPDFASVVRHGTLQVTPSYGALNIEGDLDYSNLPLFQAQNNAAAVEATEAPEVAPSVQHALVIRDTAEETATLSAEILLDELDLWHRQAFEGNVYPSFSPHSVRTIGTEYFFERGEAASGLRYGHIKFNKPFGSLMYLPRAVELSDGNYLRVSLRKRSGEGKAWLRVYKDFNTFIDVREDFTPGFEMAREGWTTILIRLDDSRMMKRDPNEKIIDIWNDPWYSLSHFEAAPGKLYGIEIGLTDGQVGDTLDFDAMSMLREQPENAGQISGVVIPQTADIEVMLRYRDGQEMRQKTDADGAFSFALNGAPGIVELFARTEHGMRTSTLGRFIELGSFTPRLEIQLDRQPPESYVDARNTFHYEFTKEVGGYYRPDTYFSYSISKERQEFFVEHKSNSFGYLDRDRRYENPNNDIRIVMAGECYILGETVTDIDSYWNTAEALLSFRYPNRDVEIINPTYPYNALYSAWPMIQNHAYNFDPDVIAFSMVSPSTLFYQIEEYVAATFGNEIGHAQSHLFDLDENGILIEKPLDPEWRLHLADIKEQIGMTRDEVFQYFDEYQLYRVDPENAPEWTKKILKITEAAFKMIAEDAAKRGIKVALFYITPTGVTAGGPYLNDGVTSDPKLFKSWVEEMSRRVGMQFVDFASEVFPNMPKDKHGNDMLSWPKAGHWSPTGHLMVGEEIVRYVEREFPSELAQ